MILSEYPVKEDIASINNAKLIKIINLLLIIRENIKLQVIEDDVFISWHSSTNEHFINIWFNKNGKVIYGNHNTTLFISDIGSFFGKLFYSKAVYKEHLC